VKTLGRLSIKSKLLLMLFSTSMTAILVTGTIGHQSGRSALEQAIFDHLTSIRSSRANEIQRYFAQIEAHVATLGEDRMVIDALRELGAAFHAAGEQPVPANWDQALSRYYGEDFVPRLDENVAGRPEPGTLLPRTVAGRRLQYLYLAASPHPTGQMRALDRVDGDGAYGDVHAAYHPVFRDLVARFGYYDLLLVDLDTLDVVYSTMKEVDFATNLGSGPHRDSNLARLVAAMREHPDRGAVRFADFQPYRPSYAVPAAFAATAIHDQGRAAGLLVVQLPVREIDAVMTGQKAGQRAGQRAGQMTNEMSWKRDGLGDTGETYLVGPDATMRSSSRFFLEDPAGYLQALRDRRMPADVVARIERARSPILLQEVRTAAVEAALAGEEGTRIIDDYRGTPVLSSFAPLTIDGLRWVIVAEMDLAEAERPVIAFQRRLLISSVVLIAVVTLLGLYLTHVFVRPIDALSEGVRKAGAGDREVVVELDSGDELGELARAFNQMVRDIRQQVALVEEKNRENESLLLNILPGPVVKRLRDGEERIADSIQQATVLFASLIGFSELAGRRSAHETAAMLNELVVAFDEAAERHGVEKVKTIGERYMAVSGLSVPRLDHARRAAELALEMQHVLQRFNREHHTDLGLAIGIHAGAVTAGIVGVKKFIYDLWGETVDTATHAHAQAGPGGVLVTQDVHARLHDGYVLEERGPVELARGRQMALWALVGRRAQGEGTAHAA
jgi:class 3 adenylate cyclase